MSGVDSNAMLKYRFAIEGIFFDDYQHRERVQNMEDNGKDKKDGVKKTKIHDLTNAKNDELSKKEHDPVAEGMRATTCPDACDTLTIVSGAKNLIGHGKGFTVKPA